MYLALAVSSAGFPPAIHVLGYSRITIKEINNFRLQDYHRLWCRFPATSTNYLFFDSPRNLHCYLTTPKSCDFGLGFFLFARRYSENKYFSLFLQVLKCFTSLGMLIHIKYERTCSLCTWVSPFRNFRIKGC